MATVDEGIPTYPGLVPDLAASLNKEPQPGLADILLNASEAAKKIGDVIAPEPKPLSPDAQRYLTRASYFAVLSGQDPSQSQTAKFYQQYDEKVQRAKETRARIMANVIENVGTATLAQQKEERQNKEILKRQELDDLRQLNEKAATLGATEEFKDSRSALTYIGTAAAKLQDDKEKRDFYRTLALHGVSSGDMPPDLQRVATNVAQYQDLRDKGMQQRQDLGDIEGRIKLLYEERLKEGNKKNAEKFLAPMRKQLVAAETRLATLEETIKNNTATGLFASFRQSNAIKDPDKPTRKVTLASLQTEADQLKEHWIPYLRNLTGTDQEDNLDNDAINNFFNTFKVRPAAAPQGPPSE